jgi:hypothetical protein
MYGFEPVSPPEVRPPDTALARRATGGIVPAGIGGKLTQGHWELPAMRTCQVHGVIASLALTATLFSSDARADQLVADDLIVQGSVCAGDLCVNGEGFVAESMRLKDIINRIRVVDTSTTGGSFGHRDWIIDFNEDNGVGDFMSFADNGNSGELYHRIMVLRAGAPSNSLYIGPSGNIGLGTATPVADLHVVAGIDPKIRLEQTGQGGFPPHTWQIFGSENGFFVSNVTAAEIPLRISSGAPSDSLAIDHSGRVRIGAIGANAPLEVRSNPSTIGSGNAVLKLVNPSGPTAMQMQPFGSGFFWNFAASDNNTFNINRSGNSAVEMSLNGSGNLTISGTIKTAGPTCAAGCDAVFDADYDLPSIEEHAEAMWAKRHLPNVGPTLPNVPVNISEQYGRMLNELETAHIYIEQLHREKVELKRSDDELRARLARLEAAIADRLGN